LQSANGCFYPDINMAVNAALSEKNALDKVLQTVNAQKYAWQNTQGVVTPYPKGELVVLPLKKQNEKGFDYKLAYKFDIYAVKPLSRAYIFIDANTGLILKSINRIETTNAVGSASTKYSGTQTITTDMASASNYRLRETGRGNGIETYNMKTGTDYTTAVDFTDNDNNWNNVNAQQDEAATDAHWGAERTYDYYKNVHNRNSYDNLGAKLVSYVHFNVQYDNAYWDGREMTYGDGDGTSFTGALTALDICAHELTHAVTGSTANLAYQNESGALNESFSDIFGNTIEYVNKPATASWLIGEDVTAGRAGLRSMSDPKSFNQPNTFQGNNWVPFTTSPDQTNDQGGVHTNSGVQNYWYYLLVQGGSGTNDFGVSYNVTGIGFTDAAKIVYRNLTVYLTPNVTYNDARDGSLKAAADLFGATSTQYAQTQAAWCAVGVGPSCGKQKTCSGQTVLTGCSGSFNDGSGPGKDYSETLYCTWLIQTPTGTKANLSFSSFATEQDYDSVRVYDGATRAARLIGAFTGTTIPPALTATTNNMLVVFNSDLYVTAAGFDANYTCTGTATGIADEFQANSINLYPNPANGSFSIKLDNSGNKKVEVSLYNTFGSKVKMFTNITGTGTYDVSDIASGIYFVNIQIGTTTINKKLVIE
jgi:Zn-dependent metalloprotease